MSPSELIFLFCSFYCRLGDTLYTRRAESDFTVESSGDQVFRCEECDYVYTDDHDVERSLCPECGRMNNPCSFKPGGFHLNDVVRLAFMQSAGLRRM